MDNEHEYDKVKGRVKQAAGALTDDDELRRSGEHDEKAGKVKEAVQHGKEKIDDAVDAVKERIDRK
jgi:uncharacterized protein YjbJ (UPF0337 family)